MSKRVTDTKIIHGGNEIENMRIENLHNSQLSMAQLWDRQHHILSMTQFERSQHILSMAQQWDRKRRNEELLKMTFNRQLLIMTQQWDRQRRKKELVNAMSKRHKHIGRWRRPFSADRDYWGEENDCYFHWTCCGSRNKTSEFCSDL